MIVYGTRASHVKTTQLTTETCQHCGTQGSVILSTYARYAHVFWIPFFPVGRFSVSQCQHCKQVLEEKQMPAQIRAHHERNIAGTRLPLWQFSGLALVLVGIAFGVYADGADKEQQARFLEAPKSGDIYELKTKAGAYTTFRVAEAPGDTVTVSFNDYEVDRVSGIYKIDKDENYSEELYYLTRAQLQEMFSAGDILDINRK